MHRYRRHVADNDRLAAEIGVHIHTSRSHWVAGVADVEENSRVGSSPTAHHNICYISYMKDKSRRLVVCASISGLHGYRPGFNGFYAVKIRPPLRSIHVKNDINYFDILLLYLGVAMAFVSLHRERHH